MAARILVVEDDPQNLYLVKFLLERAGHEVIIAVDGSQAVEVALENGPDLILMDMLLPRMDGWAATRALKGDHGLKVPIIALTAYSMKGDRESILNAGCDGYISKPIDPETFVAQVEEHLSAQVGESG
ncbi:MAG: response regulator [Coriobacteriia bacterium]|nr:response regulator [Coriobacteriia bacterium]